MCFQINKWRLGLNPSTKNKPLYEDTEQKRDTGRGEACVCAHRLHIKKEGPNYLIKGEMEQGHMVHRLSRLGGIRVSWNHRELENSTVLKYLSGGQILALMLEH